MVKGDTPRHPKAAISAASARTLHQTRLGPALTVGPGTRPKLRAPTAPKKATITAAASHGHVNDAASGVSDGKTLYSEVIAHGGDATEGMVSAQQAAALRPFTALVQENAILSATYDVFVDRIPGLAPLLEKLATETHEHDITLCHHGTVTVQDAEDEESESERVMVLPAALGVGLWGWPRDTHRSNGNALSVGPFVGALRSQGEGAPQQEACGSLLPLVQTHGFACMEAPTGSGKTAMLCWMLHQLGRRTVIVCCQTLLLEQIANRGLARFLPHLKVAHLYGSNVTALVAEADVVLTTPISMATHGQTSEFWDTFGTLIVDEAHQVAIHSMVTPLSTVVRPRYMLGVSATMRHSGDGLPIILSHLGPVRISFSCEWKGVRIERVTVSYAGHPGGMLPVHTRTCRGKKVPDFARFLNDIRHHGPRVQAIIRDLAEDVEQRGRRQIFVYLHHVEGLRVLHAAWCASKDGRSAGMLYEATNRGSAFKEVTQHQVVFTTYKSGSTGIDLEHIDTLVFAEPISKSATVMLDQLLGRYRDHAGKKYPFLRDYVDRNAIALSMLRKRIAAQRFRAQVSERTVFV